MHAKNQLWSSAYFTWKSWKFFFFNKSVLLPRKLSRILWNIAEPNFVTISTFWCILWVKSIFQQPRIVKKAPNFPKNNFFFYHISRQQYMWQFMKIYIYIDVLRQLIRSFKWTREAFRIKGEQWLKEKKIQDTWRSTGKGHALACVPTTPTTCLDVGTNVGHSGKN